MRMTLHADFAPLSGRLLELATRLSDLTPVMGAMGGVVESSTRRRLSESKTAPDGTRWAPLSDATLARKTNKRGKVRGSLLVDTGSLLSSITHVPARDSVIIGSGQMYAAYLHEGTRRMPARPIFGLSEEDIHDLEALLEDYLSGSLKG